ncbi:rho GTPase-activating protein 7-like isoform X2 [Centruroides sculpturatus]|nr:rho GTPase-activating protein 7-like isoform X2 [Centruroides sculpturatus]
MEGSHCRTDAYREIEKYLERAQDEICRAFNDLQRFQEEEHVWIIPRPPSGDFHLLVTWAEDFARLVDSTLPESEDLMESTLPYRKCKYAPECPLLKRVRPKSMEVATSCPSCIANTQRTYRRQLSTPLTRDVEIQTQWTDVCDGRWLTSLTNEDFKKLFKQSSIYSFDNYEDSSNDYVREDFKVSDNRDVSIQAKLSEEDIFASEMNFKKEMTFDSCDLDLPFEEDQDSESEEIERCKSEENLARSEIQTCKEQYSSSLPKEFTRKPPIRDVLPNRSASFSKVSHTELRDFMKKVESSAYRPPTPENKEVETEDVTAIVMRKDAVTQTTPQLSRNSSFTWVTECDCSDLDSISEHSQLSFSCSTTTTSDIGEQETTSSPFSSESSVLISNRRSSSSSLSLSSATSLKSDFSVLPDDTREVEVTWQKKDAKTTFISPLNANQGDITPDSGVETIVVTPDLIVKSSSVPTLQRHLSSSGESTPSGNVDVDDSICFVSINHSKFTELQTLEACLWLRAAGFPQYAQMYEENQFPIDLRTVQADHSFLDEDSLQSLFRRLDTLNRCAKMKAIDSVTRHSLPDDDSDEEELCALSVSWQFERSNRRWSRVPSTTEAFIVKKYSPSYSSDSIFGEDHQSSPDSTRKVSLEGQRSAVTEETQSISGSSSGGTPSIITELNEKPQVKKSLRRSGSDRIKEGAKALLRRMDSLKGKKKKKNSQEESESRDIIMVTANKTTETSPNCSTSSSPKISHQQQSPTSTTTEESSAGGDTSEGSQGSTPKMKHRRKVWRILGRGEQKLDSNCDIDQNVILFPDQWTDTNFNNKLLNEYIQSKSHKYSGKHIYGNVNEHPADKDIDWNYLSHRYKKFSDSLISPVLFNRTGSLDTDKQKILDSYLIYSGDDISTRLTNSDPEISDSIDTSTYRGRRDSGVGSSLNRTITSSNIHSRWHCFPCDPFWNSASESSTINSKISIEVLYAPQLMVLRKLSLLKVTMLMEKYTPSSRTGWNWAVPKFIRRIKTPDYKDKIVFGVPLLVILQRTGYSLPPSIQDALVWIEKTSLDLVGIFRKSGVRSRIQKLRNQNESNSEKIEYEDQQAYDVADMIKQYFRELPEALLTNKLSETFISIFQYVPEEQRLDALRAAILLMPDENREVLHTLLTFLNKVYQHAGENQMTATNLAVCFAPSLFHLTTPRSASASPRRRKTVVVLDQKELNENRAAYECLTKMILEYKQLFTVSEDMLSNQHMSYLEHCQPATLEEFGRFASKTNSDWKVYIDGCINNMLKEARDKYKEWVPFTQTDGADIAYKKIRDNYPLRLWKVVVEVEAPPVEVLNRILRERQVWDESFIKWRVITRLDKHSEIFQYVCRSMPPHPPRDYCILRSWQTDLPKGTCILIEMSINYSNKPLMMNSIQGLVLASRYLIEPCGSGKSRISYISRIDLCGHSSEWYNKAYGYISALQMLRLRDSFILKSEGPETKV